MNRMSVVTVDLGKDIIDLSTRKPLRIGVLISHKDSDTEEVLLNRAFRKLSMKLKIRLAEKKDGI